MLSSGKVYIVSEVTDTLHIYARETDELEVSTHDLYPQWPVRHAETMRYQEAAITVYYHGPLRLLPEMRASAMGYLWLGP